MPTAQAGWLCPHFRLCLLFFVCRSQCLAVHIEERLSLSREDQIFFTLIQGTGDVS